MFILAHLFTGLIVGKITGNYLWAILGAMIIDLDHLIPYIKHRIIFNPKKFWKTIIDPKDRYGNQRNFLHCLLAFIIIGIVMIISKFQPGYAFLAGYASHLFLDSIDASDLYLFYPAKCNVIGPVKYLSKTEWILTILFFLIFLIL
jgi:hypothetical protein